MFMNSSNFEEYAQTLQATMAQAIAEAEALAALAGTDREAAADVRVAIQAKLNELDHLAHRTATDYVAAHHKELKENIRSDLFASVAAKLLRRGESAAAIATLLLDVPEESVASKSG